MNILVTGASGQLGKCLQYLTPEYPELKFTFTDITELNITNESLVTRYFAIHSFDYCTFAARPRNNGLKTRVFRN